MTRSMAADAVSDPTGRSCSDPPPETSCDRKWWSRQPNTPASDAACITATAPLPTYDTRSPTLAPYQFSKYLIPVFEGASAAKTTTVRAARRPKPGDRKTTSRFAKFAGAEQPLPHCRRLGPGRGHRPHLKSLAGNPGIYAGEESRSQHATGCNARCCRWWPLRCGCVSVPVVGNSMHVRR